MSFLLSTWSFGERANAAGYPLLAAGGSALDAAVAAASAVEHDPEVDSVGLGGLPDATGQISLDASVMTDPSRCGSVCFLRRYTDAASLARRVMEKTTHAMLAGSGAEAFAEREGFTARPADALTPNSRAEYDRWRAQFTPDAFARYSGEPPPMNVEERYRAARREPSHDTVCVLARDVAGRLAGVCTTSGLAFKMPGRVGDSPIIGAGLYVDQAAGAASATGNGELIMGVCGSFLCVELMRQGRHPTEAIRAVLERVRDQFTPDGHHQVALIAVRADGVWGGGSLRPGFKHAFTDAAGTRLAEPAVVLLS